MTDCIEERALLGASRERVWRAITDAGEFGRWFGVKFDGYFSPGASLGGVIVATTVDAEVAQAQQAHAGMLFEIAVAEMDHPRLFSFRWHPFAVERDVDYSGEPTTLVAFSLEDAPDGVLITLTECGFDALPPGRRERAFQANSQGWSVMLTVLAKYVTESS